jgi:diguanylate cyclase
MDQGDIRRRVEEAREQQLHLAARAILGVLGLEAHDRNLRLLRTYALRTDPALCRAFESLLDMGAPVGQAGLDALHARFLEVEEDASGIETALARARADVALARESAVTFADGLAARLDALVAAAREALLPVARDARHASARVLGLDARLGQAIELLHGLARRIERAERFAATDSVTGLPNRRRFDETAGELVAAAAPSGRPLSLLLFDIDRFKEFNDRFGHDVGDHVLRLVAKAIAAYPGGERLAARYGGEEFALLLPGLVLADAVRVAETIREALAARRLTMRGNGKQLGPVTISVGAAQWKPGERADGLVRRADIALYRAKQAGRNRVVADDTPAPHLTV